MGGPCGTYERQERCIQGFGEGDLRERDHLEMGGPCGTYERQERCIQGFGEGDLRERDHLEDLGVGGRMELQEVDCGGACTGFIWLRIGTVCRRL
jgi:hypothetical protein